MASEKPHLAEMLLRSKLHGKEDLFRKKRQFSEDIEAVQAILFNPRYDKRRKIRKAYTQISSATIVRGEVSRQTTVFRGLR